jgi:hypothetical protein
MFLAPLVSLVILNYKLMTALRRTRRKRDTWRLGNPSRGNVSRLSSAGANGQTAPSVNHSNRSEDDITRMLIVVVLVFVISQTPALITQAFIALIVDEAAAAETCLHPFSFFYVRLSDLFVVANSSLNFIVYSFCSRRFRQILISLIRCRHTNDPVTAPDTRSHVTQNRRPIQGQEQATGRLCTGSVCVRRPSFSDTRENYARQRRMWTRVNPARCVKERRIQLRLSFSETCHIAVVAREPGVR